MALAASVGIGPGCIEAALVTGLGHEEEVDEDDEGRFDSEIFEQDVETDWADTAAELQGGSLAGDMGDVQNIDDEQPMLRGWVYDGYASFEIHAQKQDGSGAAMAIVDLQGGLESPDLEAGAHFVFQSTDYADASELRVTLIGCSGPSEGAWAFDQSANEVTVDVSEGSSPDSLVLDFSGTFVRADDASGEQQVVVGSVEFDPTQATE
jgi:hypothetical protein